eukprot:scaffold227072_cov35-Tisochrysis_lutea.AAC.2
MEIAVEHSSHVLEELAKELASRTHTSREHRHTRRLTGKMQAKQHHPSLATHGTSKMNGQVVASLAGVRANDALSRR